MPKHGPVAWAAGTTLGVATWLSNYVQWVPTALRAHLTNTLKTAGVIVVACIAETLVAWHYVQTPSVAAELEAKYLTLIHV